MKTRLNAQSQSPNKPRLLAEKGGRICIFARAHFLSNNHNTSRLNLNVIIIINKQIEYVHKQSWKVECYCFDLFHISVSVPNC